MLFNSFWFSWKFSRYIYFICMRKTWLSLSHFFIYTKSDQTHGLFTIHSSSHYTFFCPFLFHFCELVCSLRYSSMNLLALVVKFLNMLLCFYVNSSLLYASSRIRILNKLYNLPFIWANQFRSFLYYDLYVFNSSSYYKFMSQNKDKSKNIKDL